MVAVRRVRHKWQHVDAIGEDPLHGHKVAGPAIVETTDTTVVIHPGQSLGVDALGNFDLTLR